MKTEIDEDSLRQQLGTMMAEILGWALARLWLKEESSEKIVAEYEEIAEKFVNDTSFNMDEKELMQAAMKVQTSMSEWLAKLAKTAMSKSP